MDERMGSAERDEQAREIMLHSAAGQAVVAVVLHAGFGGARVTEQFSEVLLSSIAERLVSDWGPPRPLADPDDLLRDAIPSDSLPETPNPAISEGLVLHVIRTEVMAQLASSEAGDIYRRRIDWGPVEAEASQEVTELLECIDGSQDERDILLEQWRIDTQNLLHDCWTAVEDLVDALRGGDWVDEETARDLIGPIEGELDNEDEHETGRELLGVQQEALKKLAVSVGQARRDEEEANRRVTDLISSGRPPPYALAEAVVGRKEIRRHREALETAVTDGLRRDMHDEFWRLVRAFEAGETNS